MKDRRTTAPASAKPAGKPAAPRRPRFGARAGMAAMALGLAAMVPGRIEGLAGLWPALWPDAPAEPARPVVALRDGAAIATPTTAATLAGTPRFNPLSEDRTADARMLSEIARRQAEVERREREAELREGRAAAAETLARTQLTELGRMRVQLEQMVARESSAAEADLDALVSLYTNMRPAQAAKVMELLEAPRAAAVLLKIPERQAGPILASMDPPAALAVTQEIAGRREAFRR